MHHNRTKNDVFTNIHNPKSKTSKNLNMSVILNLIYPYIDTWIHRFYGIYPTTTQDIEIKKIKPMTVFDAPPATLLVTNKHNINILHGYLCHEYLTKVSYTNIGAGISLNQSDRIGLNMILKITGDVMLDQFLKRGSVLLFETLNRQQLMIRNGQYLSIVKCLLLDKYFSKEKYLSLGTFEAQGVYLQEYVSRRFGNNFLTQDANLIYGCLHNFIQVYSKKSLTMNEIARTFFILPKEIYDLSEKYGDNYTVQNALVNKIFLMYFERSLIKMPYSQLIQLLANKKAISEIHKLFVHDLFEYAQRTNQVLSFRNDPNSWIKKPNGLDIVPAYKIIHPLQNVYLQLEKDCIFMKPQNHAQIGGRIDIVKLVLRKPFTTENN